MNRDTLLKRNGNNGKDLGPTMINMSMLLIEHCRMVDLASANEIATSKNRTYLRPLRIISFPSVHQHTIPMYE